MSAGRAARAPHVEAFREGSPGHVRGQAPLVPDVLGHGKLDGLVAESVAT